jgi:hypothetical protein
MYGVEAGGGVVEEGFLFFKAHAVYHPDKAVIMLPQCAFGNAVRRVVARKHAPVDAEHPDALVDNFFGFFLLLLAVPPAG